jgi:hypothetical protein
MEIWKDIESYEGLYQVSNLGGVSKICNGKKLILKISRDTSGYSQVIFTKNKVRKSFLVHRLVAKAFLKNNEFKRCVNHKNGIKSDNTVQNLEWSTYSENQKHAYDFGLISKPKGEKHFNTKLKDSDVFEIKHNLKHLKTKEVAIKYLVSESTIKAIRNGQNWGHI